MYAIRRNTLLVWYNRTIRSSNVLPPSIGIDYHPQGHSGATNTECPEIMDPEFGEYCIVQ